MRNDKVVSMQGAESRGGDSARTEGHFLINQLAVLKNFVSTISLFRRVLKLTYLLTLGVSGSLVSVTALAQSYTVNSSINRIFGSCNYSAGVSCVNVTIVNTDNKPSSLEVHYYQWDDWLDINGNLGGYICEGNETIILPNVDCYSNSFGVSGCGASATFNIDWTANLSLSGSPSGDYCENENINLIASPGFSYIWQYRIASGSWQNFNPGSGSTVTFSVQDIFGVNYLDYLNKPINFRYSTSSCPSVVAGNGPYYFRPMAPTINSGSIGEPLCYNGTGTFSVTGFNRNPVSGETFDVTVRIANDVNGVIGQRTNVTQADLPIAFIGISPGNYEAYIESFIGAQPTGCGTVQYSNFAISNPSQVTITNPPPVSPSCHTNTTGISNNGSVTVTASGGTGSGYTYSKDNGATYQASNVLGGLTAGDYTIKVIDGNGCLSAVVPPITVSQPSDISLTSALVTSDYFGSDISCVGSTNGQITVTASGGTGTLNYSRDGSSFQGSNVFNGLGVANYTLTVRDANSCMKNSSVVPVVAPPAITASATPTSASCFGSTNGAIQVVNPAGGTGALEYSINGTTFQPGTSFPNLAANNYTVTIRDANLCTTTITTTVSQPLAIGVSSIPTLVTCSGGSDGTVQINATNAVGTPTYSLNGGTFQASNIFSGLSANAYTLAVKDGNGCLGNGNVTVSSNPIITGSITTTTPISCSGGANGALNLTPGGGVGPYTFGWSNGAITEDISGLLTGTYTVTITDTKSCLQTFNRVLTQPLPVSVSYTTSDFNGSEVSCFGNSNGSINITSSGGNGGFTYAWSHGAISEDISGVPAGSYSVTVTDSKSCMGNQTILLTQPTALVTTSTLQNIACFGGNTGSISLNTTGGTTSYEYSINNGTNWQSTSNFTNLTATTYTILTRDANGCSDSDGVTLTSPADLALAVSNIISTTCAQANGSALASATGGVSSYSFNWFNNSNALIGSNNTITNLSAGIYRVEVTDQNSCTKQQTITITSSDGPAVSVTSVSAASCSNTADGSATISITQGQTPYTILWPNGQTSETATNLAGGDYIVEVRDNTNCLALQTVTVPAPASLTIQTLIQDNPNCFGNADGAIEVIALGGNGSYGYNWNNSSTSTLLNNLIAGTYTVTVNDLKNCQAVQQFTLTDPPVFTIDLGVDQRICEGQTIIKQSNVNNATYQWSGPNDFSSNQQQVSLTQPGVYTLVVINQNGCEARDSFELSFDTNLLKADFLMVSQAFAGDTIIVIDISWPLPNTIIWTFDPAATVLDAGQDFSLIRFDEPGNYNVSILAQLAQCASSHSQAIAIMDNPNGRVGGKVSPDGMIKELLVYPNPVMDKLTVMIELNQQNQATVEIYNLRSNRKELSRSFEGNTFYETDFKMDYLQTGLYVVVVKAGNEIKSVKVIKL